MVRDPVQDRLARHDQRETQEGIPPSRPKAEPAPATSNVVNIMDALREALPRKPRKGKPRNRSAPRCESRRSLPCPAAAFAGALTGGRHRGLPARGDLGFRIVGSMIGASAARKPPMDPARAKRGAPAR